MNVLYTVCSAVPVVLRRMNQYWKHCSCTEYPAHCSSCMSALASQLCHIKSSAWFSSSVWLVCFYLLKNLPVTQFFVHHLKYIAGWNYANYILRLYISTRTAWKTNTEDDQETWHVALLSHFLLEVDANWQCRKFPLVYWFVDFFKTDSQPNVLPIPTQIFL